MRRIALTLCASLFFVGATLSIQFVYGDDVVDNAVIAHKRLADLYTAVVIYINDNEEWLDDPLKLADQEDLLPVQFWHPGDNDPLPTMIDNSLPNAPNSAQISFIFRTGLLTLYPADDFLIWDASPANNAGQFTSYITADGGIETIPPVELPFPTNVSVAQKHLRRLVRALWWYQYDHNGVLPSSLVDIFPSFYLASPRSFWNPGDVDPLPTSITNDAPNAINSTNISFDFPGAGMHISELTPGTVIMQDNSPSNNNNLGINVVVIVSAQLNSRVEFIPVGAFGDSNLDDRIDLADWARLQQCYKPWPEPIDDDSCRIHDFNSDGYVNSEDHLAFAANMTGPQ